MNSPTLVASAPKRADLSLNWVIRWAWPNPVMARQHPHQLGVLGHRATGRKTVARAGSTPAAIIWAALRRERSAQHLRRHLDGQRVQVGDPVEGVVVVLQREALAQRPEEVAEVERVGGGLGEQADAGPAAAVGGGHDVHPITRPRPPSPRFAPDRPAP